MECHVLGHQLAPDKSFYTGTDEPGDPSHGVLQPNPPRSL